MKAIKISGFERILNNAKKVEIAKYKKNPQNTNCVNIYVYIHFLIYSSPMYLHLTINREKHWEEIHLNVNNGYS